MILNRLLQKHPATHKGSAKFFLVLFAFICVAAVMIRLAQWLIPDAPVPLLLQEDGMIQTTSFEEAQKKTSEPLRLPEDLFGSEVFVVGVYPETTDHLAAGTVIAVLTKDGWRTGQITYTPNITLEEEKAKYFSVREEELVIGEKSAFLLLLQGIIPSCKTNAEGFPGACSFTKVLLFEVDEFVITIASDNGKLTDGEMIAMARSIAVQATNISVDDGGGQ
jgi:hypothetical protein